MVRLMFPTPLAALICVLVCVAGPAAIVAVHMNRSPTFSIEDEQEHFDYVQRIAQGTIPRLGERLLPSTDYLARCVARTPLFYPVPACHTATRRTLSRFYHSRDNAQYEAQQPPIYYAVTAVIRWPFIHIFGMKVLPGTRATGAIWLAAGLLLFWLAAVILGLSWPMAAAGALFIAGTPNVVLASSIVDNDCTAILAGSLVAVLGACAYRAPNRLHWLVYALLGAAVALLKTSFVLPVVAVAGLLAINTWTMRDRHAPRSVALRSTLRRWLPDGGALLAGGIIGAAAWSETFKAIALVNPATFAPTRQVGDDWFTLSEMVGAAVAMINPFTATPAPDFQWTAAGVEPASGMSAAIQSLDGTLINTWTIAAGFIWMFIKEASWPKWAGAVALPWTYIGGLGIGVSLWFTYHFSSSLPGRYGLSMAAMLMLALIGALQGNAAKRVFAVFSLATFGCAFWFILV
jgi:hypothetical protein